MNPDETFNAFKSFLQSEVACQEAISKLKGNTEVEVIIGEKISSAVFYANNQVAVEERKANNPDVVFHLKAEAVYILTQKKGLGVGELGIEICKEVLTGNISISAPGNIWSLMSNGYLDIIKLGGAEFMGFLAEHGLKKMTSVIALIRKIRKQS